MFILKLLRRLRGFVRFSLSNGFPERVLNLAAKQRIAIWDIHRSGSSISGYVYAKNYKRLRPLAKRAGSRLRLERKLGLPFVLRRHRARKGLIVGFAAAVMLLALLSRFVWVIDVSGNITVSDGEILSALRCEGVTPGALKSSLILIPAEQRTILRLPALSWLTINVNGCRAYVEVSERTVAPDIIPLSAPCNIVASDGGTIIRISALTGTASVAAGDSVTAGDLLVSGIGEADGKPLHALGEVIAAVPVRVEAFAPFHAEIREYTGRSVKKTTLHLLKFNIPLSFLKKMRYNNYDIISSTDFWEFSGGSLPFGRTVTEYLEYRVTDEFLSTADAAARAEREALRKAELAATDAAVLSRSESCELSPDGVTYVVELMLEKDIAEEREILLED